MPSLETDQVVNGIIVRMVDKNEKARQIIQANIVPSAPFYVAEPKRNPRLDRKIIIGDAIRIAEKDIVVVNAPNRQPQTVVKTTRFS